MLGKNHRKGGDVIDRQTNARLQRLESQLESVYVSAARTAKQRSRRALERFAAIQVDPDLTDSARALQLRSALYQLDRETGLTQIIADELANSRDIAHRMINGEALNLFNNNYRSQFNDLRGQVSTLVKDQTIDASIQANWNMFDRNSLNAIFNGQETQLGQLQGFQPSFTQIGFRQEFEVTGFNLVQRFTSDGRSIWQDRVSGRFYYNRAMGRLGDNADIVRRLQNTLAEVLILGEGMPTITRRIQNITGSCLNQAKRIARTETIRAVSQGRYLAATQVENEHGLPLLKIWHTALDERTRGSHEALSGVSIPKDEFFANGLMYVGDPNGAPEEIINCRCANTYRVDLAALRGRVQSTQQAELSDVEQFANQLDTLPGMTPEYKQQLIERFEQGDETARSVFNKYVGDGSVLDGNWQGTAHYNIADQKIRMSFASDSKNPRGNGVTFFHEQGHLIDYANRANGGHISVLDSALRNDYNMLVVAKRNQLHEEIRQAMIDGGFFTEEGFKEAVRTNVKIADIRNDITRDLWRGDVADRNRLSSVSDILGGITKNKIQGPYGHKTQYWRDRPQGVATEAFAHLFEAQFDTQRLEAFRRYFPSATSEFSLILEGLK